MFQFSIYLCLSITIACLSLLLAQFSTNYISLVSTFALGKTMAQLSLHLVQFSTNFISLVFTVTVPAISTQ
jgi:hypothetical protein